MMYRSLGGREVLPSSDSVQSAIRGESGALGKVVVSTALRSLFIMPGMAIAGVRGTKLVVGSLLSSATITAMLFLFYRKPMMEEAVTAAPQGDPVLADTISDVAGQVSSAIHDASAAAPGMEGLRRYRRRW